MANRNYGGGMGGRPYGGGGAVNPWEGGSIPGSNRGGSFSSNNPSNLLSQLSEPQAQLAIALTKLLQPQQEQPMVRGNRLSQGNLYNNYPQWGPDFNRRGQTDFRRNEPYNKMYNRNRDNDHNRRRDHNKSNDRDKGRATKSNKTSSKKSAEKAEGKGKEDIDSTDKPPKTENEESTESGNQDEEGEQKRDWKDEKNTEGKTGENGDDEKMETDEAGDDKADSDKEDDKDPNASKIVREGKFAGVPKNMLNCRICSKLMRHGDSFERHMKGRAHQDTFDIVEESYRIRVNMMREAIRLQEQKSTIEFDRIKRKNKKMREQQRSYCAMCDLHFYGQLFAHRKTLGHQKLKKFLHPKCNYCNKEFPTRMEWENHRHTPEHFLKKTEVLEKKDKDADGELDESTDVEEELSLEINDEPADVVTDIDPDNEEDLNNRVPMYCSKRAVGMSLIIESPGFLCRPCKRFFMKKEDSEKHARSRIHHESFINILLKKISHPDKKRKPETESEEGNWKRRKTEDNEDGENENENENDEKNETNDSKMDETGDDLYDPADSFVNDANEATLESSANVDETITEEMEATLLADSDPKEKEEPKAAEEEAATEQEEKKGSPAKGRPGTRNQKARRGRKN